MSKSVTCVPLNNLSLMGSVDSQTCPRCKPCWSPSRAFERDPDLHLAHTHMSQGCQGGAWSILRIGIIGGVARVRACMCECVCSWERRSGLLEKPQATWELLVVLFFCTEGCCLVLNGSVLNSELKSCNWCFVGLFFLFGCFYNDKGKIPVWKQHCALFWSITQNRFRLSCSVISTGITHLQACFMPWWWWLYFFKRSVILFVIWNMLSVCIRRSEKKGQNYFLI